MWWLGALMLYGVVPSTLFAITIAGIVSDRREHARVMARFEDEALMRRLQHERVMRELLRECGDPEPTCVPEVTVRSLTGARGDDAHMPTARVVVRG
jgi:hypothetical protein